MNKPNINSALKQRSFWRGNNKIRDIIFILILALVLIIVAKKIFATGEKTQSTVTNMQTDAEKKVERLLNEIDGVGQASVMICETEEGITGIIVVCEGAKDLRVTMNIREAVAAALGTEQNAVKIYLKKQ